MLLPVPREAERLDCKYQLTVPLQPEAFSVVLVPKHMVSAEGFILGAAGVGLTFTTTCETGPLQIPFIHTA